jgi:HK97 family phage major capsid protein
MSVSLREQRAKLVNDWRDILNKADAEKRGLSVDEKTSVERIEADIDGLKSRIDSEERLAALEAEERRTVPESQRSTPRVEAAASVKPADVYRAAFWNMIRTGATAELRAHAIGTDTRGGYTVPDEFRATLIQAMEEANVMRGLATITTSTSGTLSVPKVTSHGSAAWKAEEVAYAETNETFGETTFSAYKATSLVKVTEELLNDSAFNLEGYLASEFARQLADLEETAFVAGTGSGQPTGVVAASNGSDAGKTATATNAITADELMDLQYSVARPYRRRATWLMHDSTVKAIRKLKTGVSSDNTYLWSPGLSANEPDTLLGNPVVTSPDMPEISTGNKVACYGDFAYYWIVDRQAIGMQRLVELYAANGHVGFRIFKRTDGKLTLTSAVKHLVMA